MQKQSWEVLGDELTSMKEAMKKIEDELQIVSRGLAATAESHVSLQKESKNITRL